MSIEQGDRRRLRPAVRALGRLRADGQDGTDPESDRWARPGPTSAQLRRDVWLAGLVVAGAVVATLLINSMGAFVFGAAPSLVEQVGWGVALTAPLALRRRFPASVVLVVGAVFIAAQMRQNGDSTVPSIALFLAIYSLGAWGRDRTVARWVRVSVIVAMFGWLGMSMVRDLVGEDPRFPDAAGPIDPLLAAALHTIGINVLFFVAAYFFGNRAWESARREYQLEVQREQLRRSHAENARQAVLTERLRIARDLHDVVAHHVSVMGVQAAAARRVFESDRTLASKSLEAVERTARTAVGELRGLLGVLRSEPPGEDGREQHSRDAAHPSSPGVEQLPELVEETRSTGLSVRYAAFGDARHVPDAIGLSIYRVVQEALTNTVKHAVAGWVDVRLRYLESAIEVEVTDDGVARVTEQRDRRPGSGLGLIGMEERVAVHGGELEAGPLRSGGFQVRARFPVPTDGGSRQPAASEMTTEAAT